MAIVFDGRSVHAAVAKPNFLVVMADDFRPHISGEGYHQAWAHTPNLDALAARSIVFTRAYTNYPFCVPSRTSLMTGLSIDRGRFYDVGGSFRGQKGRHVLTMPEAFKEAGYYTLGGGKTFHEEHPRHFDGARSWTNYSVDGPQTYAAYSKDDANSLCWAEGHTSTFCPVNPAREHELDDGRTVARTLPWLRHAMRLARPAGEEGGQGLPFFAMFGLYKVRGI